VRLSEDALSFQRMLETFLLLNANPFFRTFSLMTLASASRLTLLLVHGFRSAGGDGFQLVVLPYNSVFPIR